MPNLIVDLNQKSKAIVGKAIVIPGVDYTTNLNANQCRTFTKASTIDTCASFFSAQMKLEGTVKSDLAYEYCYAYKFLKIVPARVAADQQEKCNVSVRQTRQFVVTSVVHEYIANSTSYAAGNYSRLFRNSSPS